MKTKINSVFIIAAAGLLAMPCVHYAQPCRYVNTVFDASVKTADVVYGTAPFLNFPYRDESSVTFKNLIMDIYQPQGDELTCRPAIVFAHSGAFLIGDRTADDMEAFCDTFARKGYVTVTIDYRKGVNILDNADLHYMRAAYRGIQDGRSAIRFLRANAATYGIDPDHIFWGGNSAGSIIGLNATYMDAGEKPPYTDSVNYATALSSFSGPDLGDPDIGHHLDYSGKPDGVMACWGGVGDTLTIEPGDDTPVFLVHGTADAIVPFNAGPPFGLGSVSAVYGSNAIKRRLATLGIPARETYFVEDAGHGFYGSSNGKWTNGSGGNEHWDTIVKMATLFYWQLHKPATGMGESAMQGAVVIWPVPSGDQVNLSFTDALHGATLQLYSVEGKLIMTKNNLVGNTVELDLHGLAEGFYFIRVSNKGNISQLRFLKNQKH